jgi:hypothetical protein
MDVIELENISESEAKLISIFTETEGRNIKDKEDLAPITCSPIEVEPEVK